MAVEALIDEVGGVIGLIDMRIQRDFWGGA